VGPWAGFLSVQVGPVNAVSRPGERNLALALAERAAAPEEWLGLGRIDLGTITIVVVRGEPAFRMFSRGRVPSWSAGAAFPDRGMILIRADGGNPAQILRHELAHLALHRVATARLPLWFDEGYALLASGEFSRADAFSLNFRVALHRGPRSLDEVNAALRGSEGRAQDGYLLAATAVEFVFREHRGGDPAALMSLLASAEPFDSAVARTTGLDPGRFEAAWLSDLRQRYSLLAWLLQGGIWVATGGLVVYAYMVRRRRDGPRRARLDEGWVVEPTPAPAENDEVVTDTLENENLS
jgi:hypothetical protein